MLLAAEPPGYPNGVPPLVSYRLHSQAPYGVNIGGAALLVIGRLVLNAPRFNTWVRRSVVLPWYLRRHRVQCRPYTFVFRGIRRSALGDSHWPP
jgi:hypothetical protein